MSNNAEYCRILPNTVEYYRMLNMTSDRRMSSIVKECQMSDTVLYVIKEIFEVTWSDFGFKD